MIKVTIIAMGRLKEKYLQGAAEEYSKRLSKYCTLEIAEIEPVKLSDKPSQAEISFALDKEAEQILKKIPKQSEVFTLCVEGKQLSSPDFAKKMQALFDMGKNVTFIIGSSYGLAERLKNQSDFRLSLSEMTFPHQLFRTMLLEQVYRAFKIIEGSTYHK